MSSKKNDTLHQIFTFTQDAPLQSTYTKEETELKQVFFLFFLLDNFQAYYEDEVKKLEGKFLNMSLQVTNIAILV